MSSPVKQYAFFFDSSRCSGCKTCQVACKDKHDLAVGVSWRRVYEVSGGSWVRHGETWTPGVFAYHISLACNQCEKPICVISCPTGAYTKREDGIVVLDGDKCIGCRYCEWACPYGAPQYDAEAGRMTKCDFCSDDIDMGRSPACVTACPARALDFGELSELRSRYGASGGIYPLPIPSLTEPAIVVKPHKDSVSARTGQLEVRGGGEV